MKCLYLRNSQREESSADINLGVSDVEHYNMGTLAQKQTMELIKERFFESFMRPTSIKRCSNVYLRRDDRSVCISQFQ